MGYSCCEPPNSSKSFLKVLFDLKICLLDENNISVFQISWQRGRAGCDYVAQILPRGKIRGAMFFVLLIGLLRLFKWSSICSVACPINNSTFKNFSRSRMEHISIIGGFLHMCADLRISCYRNIKRNFEIWSLLKLKNEDIFHSLIRWRFKG